MAKQTFRGTQAYNSVYAKLIETAKNKTTVTYVDLALSAGIQTSGSYMAETIAQILKEITLENISKYEPLLSCLVLKRGDDLPGNGFFTLVGDLKGISFKDMDYRYSFWEDESSKTYTYWE